MDDLVLRVKQIAQYPAATSLSATDAIVVQQGGVGGPYVYAEPGDFVTYLKAQDVSVASLTLPTPGSLKWNTGTPASLTFNGSSLTFTNGTTTAFTFDSSGNLTIPGAVTVAADPTSPLQVATKQYVDAQVTDITDNSVWSFNGRQGSVTLTVSDIANLGFARVTSPTLFGKPLAPTAQNPWQSDFQIATTAFVSNAIAVNIDKLLLLQPLVFTFNGRRGAVCLTLDDITDVFFSGEPTAPNPPWHDSSTRIATTRFVERELTSLEIDLSQQISDLSTIVMQNIDESALATKDWVSTTFAPLNGAQFTGWVTAPTPAQGISNAQVATTAFVMAAVSASTAGVATFNGRTGTVVFTAQDLASVNGAALTSPIFNGVPTAPTATTGTDTQQLATCAFVLNEVQAVGAGVMTFNTRSGNVTLQASDLTPFALAPLASPALTGTPTAPTASIVTTATDQIATCGFVQAAILAAMAAAVAGVSSFEGRTGAVLLTSNDISARGGALLASPALTGVPTAPTATAGTNTTQLATTAFVTAAMAAQSSVSSFNTRSGAITLTAADITGAGGALLASPTFTGTPAAPTATAGTSTTQLATTAFVTTADNLKAPLASPALTGTPTAPTATPATTNTTQIASTAFVQSAMGAAVRTDAVQTFTDAQKAQGRANVYAAPFDALAYNGMQVNGGMEVSQEMRGAAVTAPGYPVDNWYIYLSGVGCSSQQVVDAPPGYNNSVRVSITTAVPSLAAGNYLAITSAFEGYRIVRLAFGKASAQPVSIGFWVKANRTGNYSGSLSDYYWNRCYPFLFNIAASGTWEYKTLTVPGDTLASWTASAPAPNSWVTDNEGAMVFIINMAAGSNNTGPPNQWNSTGLWAATGGINGVAATTDYMQLTGVTVLPGIELPSASRAPLLMRPYGQELLTCQRYYRKWTGVFIQSYAGSKAVYFMSLDPVMRAAPTATATSDYVYNLTGLDLSYQLTAATLNLIMTPTTIGTDTMYWSGTISCDARL